jgi:DNA-binding CsgD family transcriptional regulator
VLERAFAEALTTDSRWAQGETGFWMWRLGLLHEAPPLAAAPYRAQIQGDWKAAANLWEELGCPYERALALSDGGPDGIAAALAILDGLGARPVASLLRARLREHGVPVPRGPRPATRAHPAGLTAREVEVHDLVADGLSNAEIASRLHLSRRTVEHHVSSVLAKCGVSTRSALARI